MTEDRTAPAAPMQEPLEELARFSFENAPHLCHPDHGCRPYHRAWSTIRLLSKGGALPAGLPFFAPWLQRAAVDGTCRVLLSGAADTGLAALALQALVPAGVNVQIVLADRCATTLAQNRLYAERIGRNFELHQTDLTALDCAPVDAVMSHSFLNYIPPQHRDALAAAWARVVRPQGFLVGFQRLDQDTRRRDPATFAASAAQLEAAAVAQGYEAAIAAEIAGAGLDFWCSRLTHPSETKASFASMLQRAGFDMCALVTPDSPAMDSPVMIEGQPGARPQSFFAAQRAP